MEFNLENRNNTASNLKEPANMVVRVSFIFKNNGSNISANEPVLASHSIVCCALPINVQMEQ